VGLNLNRADFYQKELDFFISSSYGPGRYDRKYEDEGLDYPLGYVRWTENRNMQEYLRLLVEGKVRLGPLIGATFALDQAASAYEALKSEADRPLMVLLAYPQAPEETSVERLVMNPQAKPAGARQVRFAVIGAGAFAKGVHLPHLRQLAHSCHLQAIVSRTGHNALLTAKQFGANYASTDFTRVLADPEVDAVLIATRHHLHAAMALEALKSGKHVLVEKPLALTRAELGKIQEFYQASGAGPTRPILLTGFNRRFSPFARRLQAMVADRRDPMILRYRMNAGHIPLEHWIHGEEGGGRNLGEACHIYDLFTYLTGSKLVQVQTQSIKPAGGFFSHRDNFVATMTFADGSVASLTYTALGAGSYPKEQLEVYVDGKVLVLDDYKRLTVFGARTKGLESKEMDKGQKAELADFARAIQQGGPWPIPLWQQVQAMEIAFQVENQLGRVQVQDNP
jgi:predicted dehydrogenase